MPPAFNLSQDQTLQFNPYFQSHCDCVATDAICITPIATHSKILQGLTCFNFSVSLVFSEQCLHTAPHPAPTPIGCSIFKEQMGPKNLPNYLIKIRISLFVLINCSSGKTAIIGTLFRSVNNLLQNIFNAKLKFLSSSRQIRFHAQCAWALPLSEPTDFSGLETKRAPRRARLSIWLRGQDLNL